MQRQCALSSYFGNRRQDTMKGLSLLGIGLLFAACLIATVESIPYRGGSMSRPCGAICYMYCPYGFVHDWRGCPICRCRERPYPNPWPKCPPSCYLACPYGKVRDWRGCELCICRRRPWGYRDN